MSRNQHKLLALIVCGVMSGLVTTGHCANTSTGQVTLGGNVTYTGVSWKFFIDPLNVEAFRLDVQFDPTRADPTFAGALDANNSIRYLNGFVEAQPADVTGLTGGLLQDVSGFAGGLGLVGELGGAPAFVPGAADIFVVEFQDLQPQLDPTTAPFTVFASPGDFVRVFDTDSGNSLGFGPNQPDGAVVGFTAFFQPVPEPGTFSLAIVGAMALTVLGRRQRCRTEPR